jgi:aminoglycoside phosphotransferase (APT) family kinase protein
MSSGSVRRWHDLIARQFPDLRPTTVVELGEGCDSVAVEVDGDLVFRFPKTPDVEEQLFIEARVLPALAQDSPLALPQFQFFGTPAPEFPRHFVGYPKLPGQPAIRVAAVAEGPLPLAPAIGRFLSWLHAYPVADAEALGVPRQSIDTLIEEVRADALDDLDVVAQIAPEAPLEDVRRILQHPPPPARGKVVLVHNDFAAEHVLVDAAGGITGVIDWSDIAISDAAVDFAGMFHWGGPEFADAVLASYRGHVDEGFRERARFMALCRGAGDIQFGQEFARPEYIRFGVRALQLCQNPRDLEP